MNKKEEKKDDIVVRVVLNYIVDQPIYDYFLKIKEDLGVKANSEVARHCIKKAYEAFFKKSS